MFLLQKDRVQYAEKAIESAEYYPDTRKRRHTRICSDEKGGNLAAILLRCLDYGRFSACRTLLGRTMKAKFLYVPEIIDVMLRLDRGIQFVRDTLIVWGK
jgi:hypothetical protein